MEENCVKRKFVNRSIHKKSEKGHSVIRESSHRVCLPCKRPGGGKAWYIYETGRNKTGQSAEAGIRTVCQIGDPHPQSVGTDGKSVSDRWDHLLYWAGNPELYRQCAGNGSPDGRQLVFPDPGVCIGGTHGTAYLSQDRQMGRCRSLSTHHRLCQFRDSPAVEYQKEGQVFGIGCKIFTISGPVILYGILSSWILGVIYLIVVSLRAV